MKQREKEEGGKGKENGEGGREGGRDRQSGRQSITVDFQLSHERSVCSGVAWPVEQTLL